jgi:hypothetical protein
VGAPHYSVVPGRLLPAAQLRPLAASRPALSAISTPAQSRSRPPNTSLRPPEPDLRPSNPPLRARKGDIRPPKADVCPSKPDVRPTKADVRPSKPDIRPTKADLRPNQADIRPTKPDIRPTKPDIRPSKPDLRPSKPDLRPSTVSSTGRRPHLVRNTAFSVLQMGHLCPRFGTLGPRRPPRFERVFGATNACTSPRHNELHARSKSLRKFGTLDAWKGPRRHSSAPAMTDSTSCGTSPRGAATTMEKSR